MSPREYSPEIARCFGENVMAARERANITQEELAFSASLHRTEIGLLERGGRLARIDTVVKLAGSLDVPPGDLLKGMAWKPRRAPRGGFITRRPEGRAG
jgi:transcriptional regulator with XRE-family HTH domain